jgi:hypothetical protein
MSIKISVLLLVCSLGLLTACKHEPFEINQGGTGTDTTSGSGLNGAICFEADILPLFSTGCAKSGCHNAASASDGYVLDSYNNIVKKGLKSGDAKGSKLYQVLLETGSDRMPPPPNAAFTTTQINLIAKWINEGAKNTTNCVVQKCDTVAVTYSKSIVPIITNNCVGCHNATDANGGYNLSNYTGVKQAVTAGRLLGAIKYLPGFSGMPQGYQLTDCQKATITKWVNAGANNN